MFDLEKKSEQSQKSESVIPEPDRSLQSFEHLRRYVKTGNIIWRKVTPKKFENLCNRDLVHPSDVGYRGNIPFPLRSHIFLPGDVFQRQLHARFADELADAAIHGLKNSRPSDSAAGTLSLFQKFQFLLLGTILITCLFKFPLATIIAANSFITLYFLLSIAYRFVLMIFGIKIPKQKNSVAITREHDLPIITILLPLYRESGALVSLSSAIDALQYPAAKKDVKLLLEEDDETTIAEAQRLGLDKRYELILIPESKPRTKPKACNYGMHLARGDLIVIFDAEDQPEPDQLLKAANAFHNADASLVCVQARLNYYNANENWLTRLFTLEYSLWFDWLLPALQRFKAPIPLGGTSNYFRTDTLLEIGGWDPYNVTEDADLGLRLSKLGYRVEILNSTTFEEANCRIGNWIRQRSRWMKGYVQTWLVHMRRPQDIIKTTGWRGFISVQLFIAGNVLSALINPILWTVFAVWLITHASEISQAFPGPLMALNIFALTVGNLFFIFLAVIAPVKRGWLHLCLAGFTAPVYWLLTSFAAYKAIWQLWVRPHYWEKTDHMISAVAIAKRQNIFDKTRVK